MNGLFGRLALLAAVAAVALVGGAGPAYRYGLLDLGTVFEMMKYGVFAAAGAGILSVIWLVFAFIGRSAAGLASIILALILAVGAAYAPINMQQTAAKVPFIHDVTTDIVAPPIFVAIKPLRADAPNGVDYVTDPAEQQKGYPDIQPLVIDGVAPADLFKRAEATAKTMGWEIVATEAAEGRIEATDTTAWFGFKDDIVIRITAQGTGSRLDIRSMSRVGKSDIGKNADRIRKFLAAVKDAK
ncbi:MAG: DUF1499 domain-containing protein [Alphaproteobacteria bacterium]|nr:DUF1499 domain-containing protein [Alphaproteobacteria bacterium]